MQVTEEMYLAVVRGLLEAEELLPQTRQTRPAVRRMHRALREAEDEIERLKQELMQRAARDEELVSA